jgi:hypothetical protein
MTTAQSAGRKNGRPLLGARITRKHPSYWLGCFMLLISSMT